MSTTCSNREASFQAGIDTERKVIWTFVISGFCAAMVGLIISSQLVAAHPATGTFFELNAIAAVVLGGTSLSGGRGSIGGTIIGAFIPAAWRAWKPAPSDEEIEAAIAAAE